jgi:hypothetical protein
MTRQRYSCSRLSLTLLLAAAAPAAAQQRSASLHERPDAPVAVLDVAMYNAQANFQETTDAAKAGLATGVLRATLATLLPTQLADSAAVHAAAQTPRALTLAAGQSCGVIVACARAVGTAVGARWVVMAKVSKTSNLIWLFTGQLIHVPTGRVILDDSTELKGDPEAMVRAGTRIFAERVARTVRAGGTTTDFPTTP